MSLYERVFCEALMPYRFPTTARPKRGLQGLKKRRAAQAAQAAWAQDVGANPALDLTDSPPTAARGEK